jgi:hypothetical protein
VWVRISGMMFFPVPANYFLPYPLIIPFHLGLSWSNPAVLTLLSSRLIRMAVHAPCLFCSWTKCVKKWCSIIPFRVS